MISTRFRDYEDGIDWRQSRTIHSWSSHFHISHCQSRIFDCLIKFSGVYTLEERWKTISLIVFSFLHLAKSTHAFFRWRKYAFQFPNCRSGLYGGIFLKHWRTQSSHTTAANSLVGSGKATFSLATPCIKGIVISQPCTGFNWVFFRISYCYRSYESIFSVTFVLFCFVFVFITGGRNHEGRSRTSWGTFLKIQR